MPLQVAVEGVGEVVEEEDIKVNVATSPMRRS